MRLTLLLWYLTPYVYVYLFLFLRVRYPGIERA